MSVEQLALPVHGGRIDALYRLAALNGYGGRRGPRERARDLLLGAQLLGEASMRWSQGWWHRCALPVPRTYEGISHAAHCQWVADDVRTNATKETWGRLFDLEVEARNRNVSHSCGWDWFVVAALPSERIVRSLEDAKAARKANRARRRGDRPRRYRPCDQIHEYADAELRTALPAIRASFEAMTGCAFFERRGELVDGMGAMPPHWYRAACALLDVSFLWMRGVR